MSQGHTKTHRAAVILHVKRVACEPQCFSEVIHDLGVMIERIRKLPRFRPVAMSKAGIIGRNKVVAIGKPGEQRLEHSRRRGQSVQQEERRGILRSRFPIKNRDAINFNAAIKDVLRHTVRSSAVQSAKAIRPDPPRRRNWTMVSTSVNRHQSTMVIGAWSGTS